jgi:hypothetical protein
MRPARAILAATLTTVTVLAVAGCSGEGAAGRPLATPLSSIQSGTVRIALHQVMVLTLADDQRYTAQVADPSVVSVVEHRDAANGRFEPELVPMRAGSTQVALTGSTPGEEVIGFRVIVTAPPTTRADGSR